MARLQELAKNTIDVAAKVNWKSRVTADEVIGEWLKHEYTNRGNIKLIIDRDIPQYVPAILNPNYASASENTLRRTVLIQLRNFVAAIVGAEWWIVDFGVSDFSGFKLINSGDWRFLTNGTLNPADAASKIENDQSLRTGVYAQQVNFILDNCERLAKSPSRLTIVADSRNGPFTVIDGVHRSVAAALYYGVRQVESFPIREGYFGLVVAPFTLTFS